MLRKFPRIIYFIKEAMPTDEEYAEAEEYGLNVVFRNASLVSATGCLEECDGVAGEVPERYSEHPTAEEALEVFSSSFRRSGKSLNGEVPDDGATGDGAEPGKGKAKADPKKAADGQPATPGAKESTPNPPANPPAWVPNA